MPCSCYSNTFKHNSSSPPTLSKPRHGAGQATADARRMSCLRSRYACRRKTSRTRRRCTIVLRQASGRDVCGETSSERSETVRQQDLAACLRYTAIDAAGNGGWYVEMLPLFDRRVIPLCRPGVQLSWSGDLGRRISDHLAPVRRPSHRAPKGKHHRKHRGRNTEGLVNYP